MFWPCGGRAPGHPPHTLWGAPTSLASARGPHKCLAALVPAMHKQARAGSFLAGQDAHFRRVWACLHVDDFRPDQRH